MAEELPPPVDDEPSLNPVLPPPGSPDYQRKMAAKGDAKAGAKSGAAAGGAEIEPPAAAPAVVAAEVAVLAFKAANDLRSKTVPLDWPFDFNGGTIDAITVRRLPMISVNQLVASERYRDLYEIYAEMTGLSAAVLRGLDSDDGERVTGVCWDFLPRLLRTAHE